MAKLMANRNLMSVTVPFTIQIDVNTISAILGERVKSAVSEWCTDIKQLGSAKGNSIGQHLLNGGQVFLYENSGKYHQITIQKLQSGIQKWLLDFPRYFSDLIIDKGDATYLNVEEIAIADTNMILQYAIYGKIVY